MALSGRRGEHVFFVYDHTVLQKEEDDLKDAIIYFSPEHVTADDQCALCGQLMGMSEFLKMTIGLSSPKLYKFEHTKFALKRFGSYSLGLECAVFVPDSVVIAQLMDLYETFVTFHGGLDSLKMRFSEIKNGFVNELGNICRRLLSVSRVTHKPSLTFTLQTLPYINVPKTASHLFLQASHLLQSCQRRPYVLAGAIFYKNEVLCSQLSSRLTRHLIFLQKELPHIEKKTGPDLPVGCKLVTMFLSDLELQDIVPLDPLARRHCKSTDFSLKRDTAASFTNRHPIHTKHLGRSLTCPEIKVTSSQAAQLEQAHEQALGTSHEGRKPVYDLGQRSMGVERLSWGKGHKLSLTEVTIKESLSERESDHGETYTQVVRQNKLLCVRTDDEGTETDCTTGSLSPALHQSDMETLHLDQCPSEVQHYQQIASDHQKSGQKIDAVPAKDVDEHDIVQDADVGAQKDKADVGVVSGTVRGQESTDLGASLSTDLNGKQARSVGTVADSSDQNVSDLKHNGATLVTATSLSDQPVDSHFEPKSLSGESNETVSVEDRKIKSSVSVQSEENSEDDVFVSVHESTSDLFKSGGPLTGINKTPSNGSNGARKKSGRYNVSFTDDEFAESDIEGFDILPKSPLPESELDTEYEDFVSRAFQPCINCLEVTTEKVTTKDRKLVMCEKCKQQEVRKHVTRCEKVHGVASLERQKTEGNLKTDGESHRSKHIPVTETGRKDIQNIGSNEGDGATKGMAEAEYRQGSSSYNSDPSSGSSLGQIWSPGMVGLNDVTLYMQSHSDICLMLVMERPDQYEENVLQALWKCCLNTLADLDYHIKDVMESDSSDKPTNDPYKFMKLDKFSSSLNGTFEDKSEVRDKKEEMMWQMLSVLHAEFDERQCMTDILLRSQSACCYGHQTHVDETYFATTGGQRPSSGLPSQRDTVFTLENVARQRMAKDKHISLL